MSRRILIIKTSSAGDILQAMYVLPFLRENHYEVDWVVDLQHKNLLLQHPLVNRVIVSDIRGWSLSSSCKISFFAFKKELQKINYKAIFDLQGNWKSSTILFFARGKKKVGYGALSVREKINLLFTNEKKQISKKQNIRLFYLSLFADVIREKNITPNMFFSLSKKEKNMLHSLKRKISCIKKERVLLSLGSFWKNKRVSEKFLLEFLTKLQPCHLFFCWGTQEEKNKVFSLSKHFANTTIVSRVSLSLWQHIIEEMDILITVDSCFLSLGQWTTTPSFSFFGPTKGEVFVPLGIHGFYQGKCPYKQTFIKQCPMLRKCKTGKCLKDLNVEECFSVYNNWKKKINIRLQ